MNNLFSILSFETQWNMKFKLSSNLIKWNYVRFYLFPFIYFKLILLFTHVRFLRNLWVYIYTVLKYHDLKNYKNKSWYVI